MVTLGSAVVYTLAIPNSSPNKVAAIKYIQYMRSLKNLNLVTVEGITKLNTPSLFYGNLTAVPSAIKLQDTYV